MIQRLQDLSLYSVQCTAVQRICKLISNLEFPFQLPRLPETAQLYFSGWPAKPEIKANSSPSWLAWAWADLGNS